MADGRVNQANGRLRSAKVGVVIEVHGDRLYLRGTLPAKPSLLNKKPYQQRLTLAVHNTPAGVSFAEKEARKVGALLDCKQFDWTPYLRSSQAAPHLIGDWVERFEADYFQSRERNDQTETTWSGDYLKVFKHLPQDQVLTVEVLLALVKRTAPDSKTRKRACMALGALARFASLDIDLKPLAGHYSPRRVNPRDLPDDQTIAQWYNKLTNPGWRWVYGVLATYGLRPHEAFRIDFDLLRQGSNIVSVLKGKTSSRRVWPCYPEWFDQFNLTNVQLPNINLQRSNTAVGHSSSEYFQEKIPFHPYDLRHCWAVRTLEFGLDVSLAAAQMGHSVQVHTEQYHAWISDRHHQRAFEMLMIHPDRPRAPEVANVRVSLAPIGPSS